jgi:hypothetical protein
MSLRSLIVLVVACGGSSGKTPDAKQPDAPSDGSGACTPTFTAPASPSPAAFVLVVDRAARSTSLDAMVQAGIVDALDRAAFDGLHLGLGVYPRAYQDPPACLCAGLGLDQTTCNTTLSPGLACGEAAALDVPVADSGTSRSTAASGPRHDMSQYFQTHQPLSATSDGAPGYEAMAGAYAAVAGAGTPRQAIALVASGGFSCASYSTRPGYSDGTCPDWEEPDSVNALAALHSDAATAVVGLPGTHSTGQMQNGFTTPPYSMSLALSTLAATGSTPAPGCDRTATFSQGGVAPANPCQIDLAGGGTVDASAISAAIRLAKQRAIGCVYDLPQGQTVAIGELNIVVTHDGADTRVLRRASPSSACASGCWDLDVANRIEIYGAACALIDDATEVTVKVEGGCASDTTP